LIGDIPSELDPEFAQNDNYAPTVQFDRERSGRTVEIQNVAVQRMLTAKFVACKVAVPQMPPKNPGAMSQNCAAPKALSHY